MVEDQMAVWKLKRLGYQSILIAAICNFINCKISLQCSEDMVQWEREIRWLIMSVSYMTTLSLGRGGAVPEGDWTGHCGGFCQDAPAPGAGSWGFSGLFSTPWALFHSLGSFPLPGLSGDLRECLRSWCRVTGFPSSKSFQKLCHLSRLKIP